MNTIGDWNKDFEQCITDLAVVQENISNGGDYTQEDFMTLMKKAIEDFKMDEIEIWSCLIVKDLNV